MPTPPDGSKGRSYRAGASSLNSRIRAAGISAMRGPHGDRAEVRDEKWPRSISMALLVLTIREYRFRNGLDVGNLRELAETAASRSASLRVGANATANQEERPESRSRVFSKRTASASLACNLSRSWSKPTPRARKAAPRVAAKARPTIIAGRPNNFSSVDRAGASETIGLAASGRSRSRKDDQRGKNQ